MDIKDLFKNKRTTNIIIVFLIGICALVIGGGMFSGQEKVPDKTVSITDKADDIETRLEKILSTVKGAGKVAVFVSLEDYGASEYAKDTKQTLREGASENEQETVMAGKTGDQTPVTVKMSAPKIKGVIVSAKGAGSDAVRKQLKSAVETSLGVPSHRVEVVEMK